jgi:hypothetical protein
MGLPQPCGIKTFRALKRVNALETCFLKNDHVSPAWNVASGP